MDLYLRSPFDSKNNLGHLRPFINLKLVLKVCYTNIIKHQACCFHQDLHTFSGSPTCTTSRPSFCSTWRRPPQRSSARRLRRWASWRISERTRRGDRGWGAQAATAMCNKGRILWSAKGVKLWSDLCHENDEKNQTKRSKGVDLWDVHPRSIPQIARKEQTLGKKRGAEPCGVDRLEG